jgi:hypothetical protein
MTLRALRIFAPLLLTVTVSAWDYHGHRMVNDLALAGLPANFPSFVHEPANAERIAYLAGGPDRWRNVDPWLRQVGPSWTDHFLNFEQLAAAGLDPKTVPSLRYDFAVAFAAGRAANASRFPTIDPARNADGTAQWPGFAPWAISEWTHKLRSAFGVLKAFEEMGGTPAEVANARADVIQAMGLLGHYVGDCAQPLHTTDRYNGWNGPNPKGYTTWRGMHSWADGGFVAKAAITADVLRPRVKKSTAFVLSPRGDGRDPLFVAVMEWFIRQHEEVETLYSLEKAGKLSNEQEKVDRTRQFPGPVDPEGRAFFESRLLTGGEMLAALWATAWHSAPIDTFLRTQLAKRQGIKPTEDK